MLWCLMKIDGFFLRIDLFTYVFEFLENFKYYFPFKLLITQFSASWNISNPRIVVQVTHITTNRKYNSYHNIVKFSFHLRPEC